MKRSVFFVSDRTGITAEGLGNSLLTQFDPVAFERISLPFIDTAEKMREVIEQINLEAQRYEQRPLVFSTLIDDDLFALLQQSQSMVIDFMHTFIGPLEKELATKSSHTVGKTHGLMQDEPQKAKIDAIGYALKHDDGASYQHYDKADLILTGVSRSGKTPTCLYMALHHGLLAANYPLTEEDIAKTGLPKCLRPFRNKLFGLSMDPERLQKIRTQRTPDSRYASLQQCQLESRIAMNLFREEQIPFVDTTSISIEEIATKIRMQMQKLRK